MTGMKQNSMYAAIIFCASFLLYAQTIGFDFSHFDDSENILDNKAFFESGINISTLTKIFTTDVFLDPAGPYYRPLHNLSYLFDTAIAGGVYPWIYHLTNVLVFALLSCALYFLLLRFNIAPKLALLSALVFATHPLFVVIASWIPCRVDSLFALFAILSMLFFIDFVQTKKAVYILLTWICFTLSLFAKDITALFPFLFLFYFFAFVEKPKIEKKHLFLAASLAVSGIVWFLLRAQIYQSDTNSAVTPILFLRRFLNVPMALSQFAVPYDFDPFPTFTLVKTILGLIVFAFVLYLVFKKTETPIKQKLFFLTWFLLLLVPAFFSETHQSFEYFDWRFMIPLVGILLLAATLLSEKWWKIKNNASAYILGVIVLFSFVSFGKSKIYSDAMTLYDTAIKHNPYKAFHYYERGVRKNRIFGDIYGALEDYNQAIICDNEYVDAYVNRGQLKGMIGDLSGALNDCNKALLLDNENAYAYNNRGIVKVELGDYSGALDDYNKAIMYNKEYAVAYNNRGLLRIEIENLSGALQDFDMAIKINNNYAQAYSNRAVAKESMGDISGALSDVNAALKLQPDHLQASCNKVVLLIRLNEYNQALQLCESILKMYPGNEFATKYKNLIRGNNTY